MDRKRLSDLLIQRNMTFQQLSEALGTTDEDLDQKITSGMLGLEEANTLIRILEIRDPETLFFPEAVT